MSEPLSELLRLRITASQYQNINEAAALAGLSISEYARRTLTANNDMLNELRTLRICVSDLTRTMQSEVAIIEILHLMRASASLSNINAAHSKMLEEGIKPLG